MISKLGLLFVIYGCFGMLQEKIMPADNTMASQIFAIAIMFVGSFAFIFCDNTEKKE